MRPQSKILRTAYPLGGFQRASAWNKTTTYRNQVRNTTYQAFKRVEPKNVNTFQLWIPHAKSWSNRIVDSPIILNERDLIQWQQFKTQRLKIKQLYLWRASQTEWVPLWSMNEGFLLLNYGFIRYSDVSFEQFTRTKWIQLNSVATASIKQLLAKFNKDLSSFACNIPKYQQQRAQNQTVTGAAHYHNKTIIKQSILLYQNEARGWSKYTMFSKCDQRYNYEFIKFFEKTFHQSIQVGNNNATDFVDAITKSKGGCSYIYHEKDKYIPYWKINAESIQLNSGLYLKINTIDKDINQINHIINDRHNTLSRQEFKSLRRNLSQIFIDTDLMKYRIEFILNCIGIIKHSDWINAGLLQHFASEAKSADTLFLLTDDYHGFPIGVAPGEENPILMNNGTYVSLKQLQQDFKNNKIQTSIALDFNGIETLIDNYNIHDQFKSFTQKMAKVGKCDNIIIQGFLTGQYVLLDFETGWLLPVYILNDQYVRTETRIVNVKDLDKCYYQFYDQGEFISKNDIQLENDYIQLSSQTDEYKDSKDALSLPRIPLNQETPNGPNVGITTTVQTGLINNAMNNAINRTTDIQQFENNQGQQQPQQQQQQQPHRQAQQNNQPHEQQQSQPATTANIGLRNIPKSSNKKFEKVDPREVLNMSPYQRQDYLIEQLRQRVELYDPKLVECVPRLIEFDLPHLVAALNDDTYILHLISQLYEQLNYRKNWTKEMLDTRPFWYNEKNKPKEKQGGKAELLLDEENDDIDMAVTISLELEVIPTTFVKLAYLGTKLYPKLIKYYPNQVHRLYSKCMQFEINLIQEAICDNETFNRLVTQAQIVIQFEERNENINKTVMTVEPADSDTVNTTNNNNNQNNNRSDNDEKDNNEIDDIEIDLDNKNDDNSSVSSHRTINSKILIQQNLKPQIIILVMKCTIQINLYMTMKKCKKCHLNY